MDWTLVFEVFLNFAFDDLQNPFQRFDFIFCANKWLKLWVFHGLCQLIAWFSFYHIFTKRGSFLNCFNMKGSSPFSLRWSKSCCVCVARGIWIWWWRLNENFDWKSLKCLLFEIVHFAKFGYGKVSIQKATILKACDPWFLISFRNHRSMGKLSFICTCLSKKNWDGPIRSHFNLRSSILTNEMICVGLYFIINHFYHICKSFNI